MLTVRFAEHFKMRRSEWMLATAMLGLGLAYLLIDGLFTNQYFDTMLTLGSQRSWGWAVASLGTMRLSMLWINGRWRVSPYFRAAGAVAGASLWITLFASAVTSPALVQSVGLWLMFFFFDCLAAYDAAGDARRAGEIHAGTRRPQSDLGASPVHGAPDARLG